MAEHNETGKAGEEIAVQYLRSKGYTILETNWRWGKNEIDIVAEDKEYLVIVEVKTRHSSDFGEPEDSVTRQKQKLLIRAANSYINRYGVKKETRFDIISILLRGRNPEVNHIIDAFYPTL
ncbi:MAG: YraN family protein [Bacteroidales bacterium]|nr:YraN family protein [Lentimicrobiaceae bacterium]MDD5694571.1 YraN family protein [Bacteroidales bacterium]